jgi:hypothetical protein
MTTNEISATAAVNFRRLFVLGAGIVTLALATASAASATDLGTVGGPAWSLNGDGSFSEAITGLATKTGTLNVYTFDLAGPANFYDVAITGNTNKSGNAVSGYSFDLTGPGVNDAFSSAGKVADFSNGLTLAAGEYTIDLWAFSTKPTGAATFGGTVDISPVPLPGSMMLFGSAIIGVGVFAWRGSRRSTV